MHIPINRHDEGEHKSYREESVSDMNKRSARPEDDNKEKSNYNDDRRRSASQSRDNRKRSEHRDKRSPSIVSNGFEDRYDPSRSCNCVLRVAKNIISETAVHIHGPSSNSRTRERTSPENQISSQVHSRFNETTADTTAGTNTATPQHLNIGRKVITSGPSTSECYLLFT
ncbi:hypothetical protein Tco_0502471 [Tanacetum coccineum]